MGNDYNLNLWKQAQIGLKAAWNCNKSIEKLFNKADADGSGGLDKSECQELLNSWKLGSIFNIDDVFGDNNENGTKGVDADHSGEISLSEVLDYAKSMGYSWDKDTKLMQAMKDVKNGIGSKPAMGLNETPETNKSASQRKSGERTLSDADVEAMVETDLRDEYWLKSHSGESFKDFVERYFSSDATGSDLTQDDIDAIINYYENNNDAKSQS